MKRLALCLLVLLAAAGEDPIVAEHGEDRITASQARALIAATDADTRRKLADPAALKTFLEGLLLQRAVLRAAEAQKWADKPEIAAVLAQAREQVIVKTFIAAQAQLPAGYPTQADVQAAYDQNKSQFMVARRYHLGQVFVPKGTAPQDDTRRRLAALRTQTQRGHATLEDAARRAGLAYIDLGWVAETQLVPAIKSAVSGLLEGTVGEPVCIDNGCHLMKLVATKPAGPASLAEVHDQLVEALKQQKRADEERAYAAGVLNAPRVAINEIELSRLALPQAK